MRAPLLALALLAAGGASAQPSNTRGLFLQVALDGQSLNYDADDFDETDDGGGLALRAGYGVSRVVTLYAGLSGARVDGETNGVINSEYDFGAGEIGARFHLLPSARLVPYLDVSLRGVAATDEETSLEFRGGGIAFGGGVSYFVSPAVALDAALRVGGGRFDEVEVGDAVTFNVEDSELDYGEGRLSLGLTFFPLR